MHRHHPPLFTALVLALAAAFVACDESAQLTEPAVEEAAAPSFSASNAATTTRESFSFPFGGPPIAAPCLGLDELVITGTVSGWIQETTTSNGHVHLNERIDFTDLTASGGGRSWTAGPGAHEIWSVNLGIPGDHALNVTHEGRSLFVGLDGAPDIRLVHRIHQVLTAELEFVVNEITALSVECIGEPK